MSTEKEIKRIIYSIYPKEIRCDGLFVKGFIEGYRKAEQHRNMLKLKVGDFLEAKDTYKGTLTIGQRYVICNVYDSQVLIIDDNLDVVLFDKETLHIYFDLWLRETQSSSPILHPIL